MRAQSTQCGSHGLVKQLTKAELPEEVVEILADQHTRLTVSQDVATKGDLHREIAASEALMEQRLRNVALEAKVGRLLMWMVAGMAVLCGILIGAMTVLQ